MFKFACISGYDQMVIAAAGNGNNSDQSAAAADTGSNNGKWAKQKRDLFHGTDVPKVQVTQRHVYAAYLSSLIILDSKPLIDSTPDLDGYETKKEFKIANHSSQINCFAVEERCLMVCSCSDENVFLSKWDCLLGHWDTKCISEDDGRILSCSITFKDMVIYITLFKSDIVLIYKVISAHEPDAPGPLILNNIECLTTLEKVKELTTWSKCVFFRDVLNVIGVASGNTVAMKHYEALPENGQIQLKLKSHRMVSYLKTIAGADLLIENGTMFVLIVGSDGESEVFSMTPTTEVFTLLYRFKIEDIPDPVVVVAPSNPNSTMNSSVTATTTMQLESRILCAKFCPLKLYESERKSSKSEVISVLDADLKKGEGCKGEGGDGDAKFSYREYDKLNNASEREDDLSKDSDDLFDVDIGARMCPKLIVAVGTTKGVLLVDVVSGQHDMIVSHGALLKDDSILIQNAQMSVGPEKKEIVLGLQSCLARVVFSRRFLLKTETEPNDDESKSQVSLIPKEALSSKSVLRKKIKSPPRQPASYPILKPGRPTGFPKGCSPPSWARSRSRPQLKHSSSRTKITQPLSARSSQTSVGANGLMSIDSGDSLTSRSIKIQAKGSYETRDDLSFLGCHKMVMSTSNISQGISVMRLAATPSGKHIAFGGNISPLIVTKTQPFQHYRIFKDISKITSIHFNFAGNLLLVASSDCRTNLVDWQHSRDLLSFEFSTKFNDHVHAQFYFMDKFIIQPEANKLAMYSYARRDNGYIKLKAGEFLMQGQNISAMGAANQFYSNMIITGLSNKSIQIFDTNVEAVAVNIPNTHSKPISCIRVNEAPKGPHAFSLCDVFLTSSFSSLDPIKLWDIRSAKCIMRISDVNQSAFVPTSRPNLSPCGRYIVSGLEDNAISFYDVRKIKNRLHTFKKVGSTILDCMFDPNFPMVWCGCRNGSILNFYNP